MPVSTPFLSPRELLGSPTRDGVLDRLRTADVRDVSLFGHGKVALREALSRAEGGSAVLLPGYVTRGVVGAVEAAGYRPRFYRLHPDLSPNLDDLASKLDDDAVAVLAVHYFGFPTADVTGLERRCEDAECYLLVDNAHSPLSRDGSRPLGTGGDAGFTSLHKQFPVPDGAVLAVSNPDLLPDGNALGGSVAGGPGGFTGEGSARRDWVPGREPGPTATPDGRGVAGSYTASDLSFCAESMLRSLAADASRRLKRITGGRGGAGGGSGSRDGGPSRDAGSVRSPAEIYLTGRTRASRLTLRVVERVDPDRVVRARRRNYRFWLDVTTHGIDGIPEDGPTAKGAAPSGVVALERAVEATGSPTTEPEAPPATPPLRSLAEGVCPQVFPLVVEDPDALARSVGSTSGIATWPRLPPAVAGDEAFPTANHLANHLVRLPVHQGVDPRDLVPVARRVREYATGGP